MQTCSCLTIISSHAVTYCMRSVLAVWLYPVSCIYCFMARISVIKPYYYYLNPCENAKFPVLTAQTRKGLELTFNSFSISPFWLQFLNLSCRSWYILSSLTLSNTSGFPLVPSCRNTATTRNGPYRPLIGNW
jgi:hypothetical protein